MMRRVEMEIGKFVLGVAAVLAFCCGAAYGQSLPTPFRFLEALVMPEVPPGPYTDHMAVYVAGKRLFTTPQANKAVDVFDLRTNKLIKIIPGFGNPHAIFYCRETNKLFVTDGGAGALKVFDGNTYELVKTIPLAPDADGLTYDTTEKRLYVTNGGDAAGKSYTLISVIDVMSAAKLADIRVEASGIEATAIDASKRLLFADLPEKNQVAVVDLKQSKPVAYWPIKLGRMNMAMAIDFAHRRLYIGCRDTDVRGSILVLDLDTGHELERLSIGGWVDSLDYDAKRSRIYASCGTGQLFTYQRMKNGKYHELAPIDTAVMAKTSLYSPQLDREFVSAPHLGDTPAKILVFQPQD